MLILFENAPKKNFWYPFTIGFLICFFCVFSIRGLLLIFLIFVTVLVVVVVVGYYSIHRTSLPLSRARFSFLHTYSQFVVFVCIYSSRFFHFFDIDSLQNSYISFIWSVLISRFINECFYFRLQKNAIPQNLLWNAEYFLFAREFFLSSRKIQIRCEKEIQSNKQFRIDLTIYRNATLIANKQSFF